MDDVVLAVSRVVTRTEAYWRHELFQLILKIFGQIRLLDRTTSRKDIMGSVLRTVTKLPVVGRDSRLDLRKVQFLKRRDEQEIVRIKQVATSGQNGEEKQDVKVCSHGI